jgi:CheY-like chemotaxis protein
MMPQLDGFGLLRAIRDDPTLTATPVILLSARAGEESRVEGLQGGADDYLVKPFTARELQARVEAHLKMANLRRDSAEREERLRSEAALARQKLHASQELLTETSRLYQELQEREAEIRTLKDRLYRENLALRDEVDRTSMFEEIVGSSDALMSVLLRIAKVAPTDSPFAKENGPRMARPIRNASSHAAISRRLPADRSRRGAPGDRSRRT